MAWDLSILLVFGLVLRVLAFTGLALGDDYAYTQLVDQLIERGYPRIDESAVLSARPVMLYVTAMSVAVLGWSEFGLAGPAMLSSLVVIGATYLLARRLAGRRSGVIAALIMIAMPVDLVHATTLSDDLVGSGLIALAALLFSSAALSSRERSGVTLALAAGVLVALSTGVKLSFLVLGIPLVASAVVLTRLGFATRARSFGLVGGWLLGQLALCLFLGAVADRPLAHFETELAFQQSRQPGLVLADASFWVERIAGIPRGGHDGFRYSEYGLVFVVAILGLVVGLASGRRRWAFGLCLLWMSTPIVVQLLWPALVGEAAAARRLAQSLHVAVIPAAIVAGSLWRRQPRRLSEARRLFLRVVWLVLAVIAVKDCARMSETFRDAMADQRHVYATLSGFGGQFAADAALCEFVEMKNRFRGRTRCSIVEAPSHVQPRALVIVGGSRRPELDPGVAVGLDWDVPTSWVQIARLPGGERPWRRAPGRVYLAVD